MPFGIKSKVNIGSGDGLLLNATKLQADPVFSNNHQGIVTFTWW